MASRDEIWITTSKPGNCRISLAFIAVCLIFGGPSRAQEPPDLRAWQSLASRLVDQGDRLLSNGEFGKAISSFDQAISLESKNAYAYMGRALAEQRAGKLDDAAGDYIRALKIQPHVGQLHCNYGSLLMLKGDLNGATEEFNQAIKLDKHIAEAHAALGMINFNQHNFKDALDHLNRAIRFFPPYLEDAVKLSARNPHLASAYDLRGLVRQSSGDLEGALEDYDRAIAIDGKARFFNNRGQARSRNGDLSGAIEDYNQALQIDPTLVMVYFNRGQVRLRNKDLDGAAADFTATLTRSDDLAKSADSLPPGVSLQSILYTSYLSRGLASEGKGDLPRAEKDYDQAIKSSQGAAVALACMGRIYLETGRLDDAIRELDLAIAKDPQWAMAFMDRGITYMMQGKQAAAQDDFAKCISLNPSLKKLLDLRVQSAQARLNKLPR